MTRWFTSDLHLGHTMVSEHRGFASVRDHDNAIVRALQGVPATDELWILGDVTNGSDTAERAALKRLKTLKKTHMHLVAGNHDSCASTRLANLERLQLFRPVFASVQSYARVQIQGENVLLSHYPYSCYRYEHVRDGKPVKHLQWHLPDLGEWLLHGHLHTSRQIVDKQVHIGLDAWALAPVREEQVWELMQQSGLLHARR